MGRLKLIVMVAGGMLAWFGFEEFKVSQGTTDGPADVDLVALESGEASVENPHIRLGDHVASYWDCIYQYEQKGGAGGEPGPDAKVNHVYYPVLSMENPYLAEVAAFQEKFANADAPPDESEIPKITKLVMLAKTREFPTVGAIPGGLVDRSGTEGLVVNRIESLSGEEIELLRQGFPGFDPERVHLLEIGRKPSSKTKSFGMMGGGGVLALLALVWLFAGFRQPAAR